MTSSIAQAFITLYCMRFFLWFDIDWKETFFSLYLFEKKVILFREYVHFKKNISILVRMSELN